MHIPAFLYGTAAAARGSAARVLRRLRQRQQWRQVMSVEEMAGTADHPGLLLLEGPSPLLGRESHFHCYLAHQVVLEAALNHKIAPDIEEAVFAASLSDAWSTLALLGPGNIDWLFDQSRLPAFLGALRNSWDSLVAEGPRYSNGLPQGLRLWQANTTLPFALRRTGVPETRTASLTSADVVKGLLNSLIP